MWLLHAIDSQPSNWSPQITDFAIYGADRLAAQCIFRIFEAQIVRGEGKVGKGFLFRKREGGWDEGPLVVGGCPQQVLACELLLFRHPLVSANAVWQTHEMPEDISRYLWLKQRVHVRSHILEQADDATASSSERNEDGASGDSTTTILDDERNNIIQGGSGSPSRSPDISSAGSDTSQYQFHVVATLDEFTKEVQKHEIGKSQEGSRRTTRKHVFLPRLSYTGTDVSLFGDFPVNFLPYIEGTEATTGKKDTNHRPHLEASKKSESPTNRIERTGKKTFPIFGILYLIGNEFGCQSDGGLGGPCLAGRNNTMLPEGLPEYLGMGKELRSKCSRHHRRERLWLFALNLVIRVLNSGRMPDSVTDMFPSDLEFAADYERLEGERKSDPASSRRSISAAIPDFEQRFLSWLRVGPYEDRSLSARVYALLRKALRESDCPLDRIV
ncbi:unnamed protein product, partial [Amoebophrya sp. A25]|eukprot:GSA25T00018861001.1